MFAAIGHQTCRGEFFDRVFAYVDQADIGPVKGCVIAGVDTQALAAERVLRRQQLRRRRVAHDGSDLATHEFGGQRVGARIEQDVVKRPQKAEAADAPACLEPGLKFLCAGG